MNIEVDIGDRQIGRIVVEELGDYRAVLKTVVVGYSTPVHSFDPAKEKKEVEKDIRALKRVIRMYR